MDDIVLDAAGNVVSGGRPGQRRPGRPRSQTRVSAQRVRRVVAELVGLTRGEAQLIVDDVVGLRADFLADEELHASTFRAGSIRVFLRDDIVVRAEPD